MALEQSFYFLEISVVVLSYSFWLRFYKFSSEQQILHGLTLSAIKGFRGKSRISEKGAHGYKGVGFRFADFIKFFLLNIQ